MSRNNEVSEYANALLDRLKPRLGGSKKAALSAGLVALSKLSAQEQQDLSEEAMALEKEKRADDLPEHVQELIDAHCREIVHAELAPLKTEIKKLLKLEKEVQAKLTAMEGVLPLIEPRKPKASAKRSSSSDREKVAKHYNKSKAKN